MSLIISRATCPGCGSAVIGQVMSCKDYTVTGELFDIWECKNCTLRFTQHVPGEDGIGHYYQSDAYISHTDTEKGLVNKAYKLARNYTLKWKMRLVQSGLGKEIKKGSLLDIGCGTGAFLNVAGESGWSVLGLEPDAGARQICADKYGVQAKLPSELFALPSATYDVVTMWHVLEHVHQLHEYISEIKRVLKPKGLAFVALPNYTSDDAKHYQQYWAAYDVPRHLYHFSPKALKQLVEQHQLKVISHKPMWLDAFYIALLSEGYKNGKPSLGAAFVNGLRSNLWAFRHKMTCSSLVYIIQSN